MFIDRVVWIGAKLKRDQWHKKSVSIIRKFLDKEIERVYITDHIVLETVNFILRKGGFDATLEILDIFENHERIEVMNVNEIAFARAFIIFKKYPGLSITDATTVATMENLGISQIYTFDEGFDKIDWVERLEYP